MFQSGVYMELADINCMGRHLSTRIVNVGRNLKPSLRCLVFLSRIQNVQVMPHGVLKSRFLNTICLEYSVTILKDDSLLLYTNGNGIMLYVFSNTCKVRYYGPQFRAISKSSPPFSNGSIMCFVPTALTDISDGVSDRMGAVWLKLYSNLPS
jgi:hypothetical protein